MDRGHNKGEHKDYPALITKAIEESNTELARSLHSLFSDSATSKEDRHQVHELGNKILVLIFNQFFDRPPEA